MKNNQSFSAKSLLRFDLIILIIILFVPLLFFPKNAFIVILTTFLVLFSRSSSLYDNLKVEFHSVLIIVIAHLHGFAPAMFIALASAPLINNAGKYLGSFQKPPWIVLDTVYLIVLSFVATLIPAEQLFYYGLWTIIIFGNGLIGFLRVYIFMDPITRRLPLSVINIMFNYLILKNFLPQILAFLR